MSWQAPWTSSRCRSSSALCRSRSSMSSCTSRTRRSSASVWSRSCASIRPCSSITVICAVRFPVAPSSFARIRSPWPTRWLRARSSASTSAAAAPTRASASRYARRQYLCSVAPSASISDAMVRCAASRLPTSCSPTARSCRCLVSRSCSRCCSPVRASTSLSSRRRSSSSTRHCSCVFCSTCPVPAAARPRAQRRCPYRQEHHRGLWARRVYQCGAAKLPSLRYQCGAAKLPSLRYQCGAATLPSSRYQCGAATLPCSR